MVLLILFYFFVDYAILIFLFFCNNKIWQASYQQRCEEVFVPSNVLVCILVVVKISKK